jgi:hypothetical protein
MDLEKELAEVKGLLQQILSSVKKEMPKITEEEAQRRTDLLIQACIDMENNKIMETPIEIINEDEEN